MILINNPWGESNEKGLKAALAAKNIPYAGIEKFEDQRRRRGAAADAASRRPVPTCCSWSPTSAPSSQVVKSLDRMGWNVPIVSHWGPAGGRFTELAGAERRQGALHPNLSASPASFRPRARRCWRR